MDVVALVRDMIEAIDRPTDSGSLLLTIVALLALLYSASSFFFQLRYALNRIWGVLPQASSQTKAVIRHRLLSFLVVLALGLVLVAVALVVVVGAWLDSWLELGLLDAQLGLPAFVLATAFVFAVFYKVLPDADVSC